ncbi:uncharacterized protein FIESC28_05296 [Fusarium coffeatum]|uniref:Uncharacterized protein n=1 Tax=Fusarium coffeatum TaxID=231269 RepID=A0A366RU45_9HYPO|nr:uncharacterized protein FIESC28_05296 [Fusarium coffeatum]RBR20332.1 hypothetical protein FIESC28_05296 [Fusarium coffeatum]
MRGLLLVLGLATSVALTQNPDGPDDPDEPDVEPNSNDVASALFTLVSCENISLDGLLFGVWELADKTTNDLETIIDGATFGFDDGSEQWYMARNMRLLFGADYSDIEGQPGRLRFEDKNLETVESIRFRYQALAWAINKQYWSPASNYIFCRPEQDPLPFKHPEIVKEFYDLASPAELQVPLRDMPG